MQTTIVPAGPLVPFTTSPSAGDLVGLGVPQIVQSGSAAATIAVGVTELPGLGIRVQSGIGAWDPVSGLPLPQPAQPIQGLALLAAPAIADVSGDGLPDVILPTDSAALHAWDGRTGQTVGGFPKSTGGFSLFTPAIGDVDGDCKNEIALATRYVHLFRTAGAAGARRQAWHWHQDNHNSGRWGADPDVRRECPLPLPDLLSFRP